MPATSRAFDGISPTRRGGRTMSVIHVSEDGYSRAHPSPWPRAKHGRVSYAHDTARNTALEAELPDAAAPRTPARSAQRSAASIKIVGVGGGGSNAIHRMIAAGLQGVEFIAVNTDAQALLVSDADIKLDIGRALTRGLGAGANAAIGRQAAEQHHTEIENILGRPDMVVVTAGEGGGTGTGATPVIAAISRSLGALTIGVVTCPFTFEGRRRAKQAEAGVTLLHQECDALIAIPNDRLLQLFPAVPLVDAFRSADEVLLSGVRAITTLITTPGLINLDFADVRSIMSGAGSALMGMGAARGQHRARQAVADALHSPLLEASINGARAVLLSIAGNSDLGLFEINEAATQVQQTAHPEANIIFGTVIDESLADEVRVTLIAASLA